MFVCYKNACKLVQNAPTDSVGHMPELMESKTLSLALYMRNYQVIIKPMRLLWVGFFKSFPKILTALARASSRGFKIERAYPLCFGTTKKSRVVSDIYVDVRTCLYPKSGVFKVVRLWRYGCGPLR